MIINNECARVLLKEVSMLGMNKNLVLDEFILNHPEFSEEERKKEERRKSLGEYLANQPKEL